MFNIPDFVVKCREAGLKIASSEIADLLQAINLLGWEKERVYLAMLSALVKEEKDKRAFDKLFRYYFSYYVKNKCSTNTRLNLDRLLKNPPRLEQGQFTKRILQLQNTIRDELAQCKERCGSSKAGAAGGGSGQGKSGRPAASSADKLVLLIKSGDTNALKALVQEHLDRMPGLAGEKLPDYQKTLRELKVALGWAEAQHRVTHSEEVFEIAEYLKWQETNRELQRIIQNELEEAFLRRWPEKALEQVVKNINFKELEFNRLNEDQVDEIRYALKRLARKLVTRCGYRYARARRGMIDLRRTAARAVQTGGVPLKLYYRQRVPDRPEIVVIYDLSGSVALFSEFMLQLVYTLHQSFKKVHSFAFVDRIAETTTLIKGENLTQEIKTIIEKTKIARTNFSNYGYVWKQFVQEDITVLTPKSTVLVLGDARNNWNPTGEEYLKLVRDNCKKLIWLNPSPVEKWNTEDSIMSSYARYCDQVFECRNLHQLELVALKIF